MSRHHFIKKFISQILKMENKFRNPRFSLTFIPTKHKKHLDFSILILKSLNSYIHFTSSHIYTIEKHPENK